MECIEDNTMVDLLEGRLDDGEAARVHAHLDLCSACRTLLAGAALALDPPSDPGAHSELTVSGLVASEPSPSSALAVGTDVDHFHVLRHIGRGGMGEVYIAHDRDLDRRVALKVVKASLLTSERARERFVVEARATARLNHPNIVTIHAIGEHEGVPYVALELLDGVTLRQRISKGPLTTEESRRIARAIAEALEAAHEAGVFHRDLKPSNVMLGRNDRLSVLDFGLAQLAAPSQPEDRESLLLRSMKLGGTPTYMAPEQWRREPSSGATDVWALGVVLHEMILGQRPFEGDAPTSTRGSADALRDWMRLIRGRVCAGDRLDPASLVAAGMPRDLADLVARCLEPDPTRRPTAAEMVTALEAPSAGEEPPAPSRLPRRLAWAAALGVGIVGLALAVGGTALDAPSPAANAAAPSTRPRTPAVAPPNAAPPEAPAPEEPAPEEPAPEEPAPEPPLPAAPPSPAMTAPVVSVPAPPRTPPPVAEPNPPTPPAPEPAKDEPWNPMRYR